LNTIYKNGGIKLNIMREQLIKTILELSGDEFENVDDMKVLALESEEELTNRVMNIAYSLKQELDTL